MSKVVAIEHITLDGVMQGPARPEEDTRDGFEYGGYDRILAKIARYRPNRKSSQKAGIISRPFVTGSRLFC